MAWLRIFRDRAKLIKDEADAMIDMHGEDAYYAACDMERQANSLSESLYWRAVRNEVSRQTKVKDGVTLLPCAREQSHLLSGGAILRNARE